MDDYGKIHYVCDFIDDNSDEAKAANELGLTLRARLKRSKGEYAMLEGSIFNPKNLVEIVCNVTNYKTKEFKGGDYQEGYTHLTVTADGCTNEYLIFNGNVLEHLLKKIKMK